VKRILRYLSRTQTHGLLLRSSTPFSLLGFSDADWAMDLDDRKSTSGCCVYLVHNLISWFSQTQKVVSRSSIEAEYRSIAALLAETKWVQNLLFELRLPLHTPTIFSGNLGAILMASNPVMHSRSKHFETTYTLSGILFTRKKSNYCISLLIIIKLQTFWQNLFLVLLSCILRVNLEWLTIPH